MSNPSQPLFTPLTRYGRSPIPFTGAVAADLERSCAAARQIGSDLIGTVDAMSRRIDDLARELNCLGYFDDDDDGPRAA